MFSRNAATLFLLNYPLRELCQPILTTHAAGMTVEYVERAAIMVAKNIIDFSDGRLRQTLTVNTEAAGFVQKGRHKSGGGTRWAFLN